jgi:mono/diheme cytochrome c family protein
VAADAPPAAPPLLGTAARQLVRKEGQAAGKVDGKALYGVYCTNCHGPEGNGDGVAAASLNPRPKPFRESLKGRKDEELLDIMARGRGQMPGWGNVLSDEQLKAILGYIKELAKK